MQTKYEMVVNILEKEMLEDRYILSKKLPTEEELIKKFNVSKNTIRKAIEILVTKGYVIECKAVGYF